MADLVLGLSDGVGAAVAAPTAAETPGVVVTLRGQAEGGAPVQRVSVREADTLPVLVFLLVDGDAGAYDLKGATVRLRVRARGAAQGTYKIDAACTIVTSGLVTYALQAADVDTAGEYWGEVRMTFAGGAVYTTEQFVFRVLEAL